MKVDWAGYAPPMAPQNTGGHGKLRTLVYEEDSPIPEDSKGHLDSIVESLCCCREDSKKASSPRWSSARQGSGYAALR